MKFLVRSKLFQVSVSIFEASSHECRQTLLQNTKRFRWGKKQGFSGRMWDILKIRAVLRFPSLLSLAAPMLVVVIIVRIEYIHLPTKENI